MHGTLFIVATPIGNMGDITLRGLETLRTADVILCEDTREAHKLLLFHGITGKKLFSYHAQSRQKKEEEIMTMLHEGRNCVYISDRGTPGISDPGAQLVSRARINGILIVPIPGSCAFLTALQGAGCDTSRFIFYGFLPHKKGRQTMIHEMLNAEYTTVFYESPHRVMKCLQELRDAGSCARRLIIARELTKIHEEFLHGTVDELHEQLSHRKIQGEFVMILPSKNSMGFELRKSCFDVIPAPMSFPRKRESTGYTPAGIQN